jgi:hypothetical protein
MVMGSTNRGRARRHELREQALERAEQRAKRTSAQQLDLLDKHLGDGVGAQKERRRLQNLIDNPPRPKKGKKNDGSKKNK